MKMFIKGIMGRIMKNKKIEKSENLIIVSCFICFIVGIMRFIYESLAFKLSLLNTLFYRITFTYYFFHTFYFILLGVLYCFLYLIKKRKGKISYLMLFSLILVLSFPLILEGFTLLWNLHPFFGARNDSILLLFVVFLILLNYLIYQYNKNESSIARKANSNLVIRKVIIGLFYAILFIIFIKFNTYVLAFNNTPNHSIINKDRLLTTKKIKPKFKLIIIKNCYYYFKEDNFLFSLGDKYCINNVKNIDIFKSKYSKIIDKEEWIYSYNPFDIISEIENEYDLTNKRKGKKR